MFLLMTIQKYLEFAFNEIDDGTCCFFVGGDVRIFR